MSGLALDVWLMVGFYVALMIGCYLYHKAREDE